jgi:hypothetical protein
LDGGDAVAAGDVGCDKGDFLGGGTHE